MKKIYYILLMIFLSLGFISNTTAQLTIVKAVAIDRDMDGDTDGLEIEFSDTIDFSESNDQNSDWSISNHTDMSNSVTASDFTADVEYIANVAVDDDLFARVEFTNNAGGALADDNSTPIYFLYTQTNAPNDAVVSEDHSDTLATMTTALLVEDYSPPKIISSNLIEIGVGAKFEVDDTIKFEITLLTEESGITILPDEYNGRDLNWSTSDNKTFQGVYVVTEGDPDQTDLNFNGVYAKDVNGNISLDSEDFNVTMGIDANRPEISAVFYSPGDGNVLGIDSVLIVTMLAKNSETGLFCDNATVNGVDVTGSFSAVGGSPGYYTVEYTVSNGDGSIDDATEAIPITLVLDDLIYLTSPVFEDSTISASPGIDDTAPVNSGVTVIETATGTSIVGDSIKFTVDVLVSEEDLNVSPSTYNGRNLNWTTEDGGDTYLGIYAVTEGDPDQASALDLPNIKLTDPVGNVSNPNTGDVTLAIDAHTPEILTVTSNATAPDTLIGGGQIIFTVDIKDADNTLTIIPAQYNGRDLNWAPDGTGDIYTGTYDVTEGDKDQGAPLQLTGVIASDPAGNVSNTFNGNDVAVAIDANTPLINSVTVVETGAGTLIV